MITDNITLDDLETNTVFEINGTKYRKGFSGTYGKDGYTICYPFLGGQFQTKEKFEIKIPNKEIVIVY